MKHWEGNHNTEGWANHEGSERKTAFKNGRVAMDEDEFFLLCF